MILCRECGNSAPSKDGFCSACGALLDWSGEKVETRVLPVVPAVPSTATAAADVTKQHGAAAQHNITTQPDIARQSDVTTRPGTTPPPADAERSYGSAERSYGSYGSPGWTPTAEARRADPVPVASEPEYTGPYCQECGVRNPQDRQFCRSCGALLQSGAAGPAPRRGWWRRLFDRLRGRREFAAGERPSGFRDHAAGAGGAPHKPKLRLPRYIKPGKLAPLLVIAGLVGIGLGPARSWVTTEVSSLLGKAKSRVSQHYANVTPVGAKADAEPGHAAGLAIDGVNTTYWASSQHHDGTGDTITVTFASPVDIDQIGILSGADPADFRASARPHDLTVAATGAPDATLGFEDSADFQNRPITLRHVTTVTITVKDAYPGQKKHDLAVRDLEFFVKSS